MSQIFFEVTFSLLHVINNNKIIHFKFEETIF